MATAPLKFNLNNTTRLELVEEEEVPNYQKSKAQKANLEMLRDERSDDEESDFRRATFKSSDFNLRLDPGLKGKQHMKLWAEPLEENKEGESI